MLETRAPHPETVGGRKDLPSQLLQVRTRLPAGGQLTYKHVPCTQTSSLLAGLQETFGRLLFCLVFHHFSAACVCASPPSALL